MVDGVTRRHAQDEVRVDPLTRSIFTAPHVSQARACVMNKLNSFPQGQDVDVENGNKDSRTRMRRDRAINPC